MRHLGFSVVVLSSAALLWGGCSGGSESELACEADQTLCTDRCVDTQSDPAHCGSCSIACGSGERCEAGSCLDPNEKDPCPFGQTACEAGCADLSSDAENCGECGNRCLEGEDCAEGECTPIALACDPACGPEEVCEAGVCVCGPGLSKCGGACVDTKVDSQNCGDCEQACAPDNVCANGVCACPPGTKACDGTCVDTDINDAHCGECFQACGELPNAIGGVCSYGECRFTCAEGFADCDEEWLTGCETSVLDDKQNCGRCGENCDDLAGVAETLCHLGNCEILACAEGRGNCDLLGSTGCETFLLEDPHNCGKCGMDCAALPNAISKGCADGTCEFECVEGWEDCDQEVENGCESDLRFGSTGFCGTCGLACEESEYCWEGQCAADPTVANWPIPPDGVRPFDTETMDGVAVDPITGLEWQRDQSVTEMKFWEAEQYCQSLNLHGDGWRMPSLVELLSIADYSKSAPVINEEVFPDTTGYFWTSVRNNSYAPYLPWKMNSASGIVNSTESDGRVRCVRGIHTFENKERYELSEETVKDLRTRLEWRREIPSERLSLPAARTACDDLIFDGKSDWRLPTFQELSSIIVLKEEGPLIDTELFRWSGDEARHWVTNPLSGDQRGYVNLAGDGTVLLARHPRVGTLSVRYNCVRDFD